MAASILAFILLVLFGIAIILTSTLISAFLFARFVLHIRSQGPRSGILEWAKEIKSRLYGSGPGTTPVPPHVQFYSDVGDDTTSKADVKQEPEDDSGEFATRRRSGRSPGAKHKRHHGREDRHSVSNASTTQERTTEETPIKGAVAASPELLFDVSSSSSSESEDHEEGTFVSTVIVKGFEDHALGPAGLGVTTGGELKGASLVEDSPIFVEVKTNGDFPGKFD